MSMTDDQLAKHFEDKKIRDARGHIQWVRDEIMKTHENTKARLRSLLKEVHDKKSYVPDFGTFENYCRKEWKLTKARAYQILNGEKFRLLLEGEGVEDTDSIPDGQIDELGKVDPKKAAKVYNKVKKKADKDHRRITAKDIAIEINPEVIPPSKPIKTKTYKTPSTGPPKSHCVCPTCGGSGEIDAADLSSIPD